MTYRHTTIVSCLALMLAFALPSGGNAKVVQCTPPPTGVSEADLQSWIRLQVPIPGITTTCTDDGNTTDLGDDVRGDYVKDVGAYIGGLYKYFVGVIGIIAAVMVFYGGLQWLTAGGNASRVKSAKETIFAALIAILIAFGSYTLLYTINPKLVVLNPPVLKVADTFLTSFDNTCSTTKVCLHGANIGRSCTSYTTCGKDADGKDPQEGACGLPIEDLSGNNITTATCGTRYKYKKILGVTAPSETCIGSYCEVKEYPMSGNEQLVCKSKKDFSKPPTEGDAVCTSPSLSCGDISKPSQSLCSAASIPGEGKCQYVDTAWYNPFTTDHCVWGPPLTCDPGYVRVGCGACTNLDVSCKVPSDDYLLDKIINALNSSGGKCDAMSTGETVYALDLTADKQNTRSICCQQTVCIGGSDAGDTCKVATDCNSGLCGPNVDSADKSDFRCKSSDKS